MRITLRHQDIRQYWDERWTAVPVDAPQVNLDAYPAKYAEVVVRSGGRVLEAGCGAGRLLRHYAGKGVDIIGMDFVERVVTRLKEVDPSLRVEAGDIRTLRFPDRFFRSVLAFGLYHNLHTDLDVAITETYRVLEPGGRVCASFRADNVQTRISDWLGERKAPRSNAPRMFHKMNLTRFELDEAFARSGFTVDEIIPVENMPLLYKFRVFRAPAHKDFNESLGRREGYRLSVFAGAIQRALVRLFPNQFCNVYVLIGTRPEGT